MPMESIVLNGFEEILGEYPGRETRDDKKLSDCAGTHGICPGFIDIRDVSQGYKRLVCRRCGPIPGTTFPVGINTYGELRGWCAQQITKQRNEEIAVGNAIAATACIGGGD